MYQQMTKKEFWKTQVDKGVRQKVVTGAVVAYISAAMTAIVALIYSPLMFLDVALILGLALGIQIGKSRACAIILTIYYLISKLLQAMEGDMSGANFVVILFILAYVLSIVGTFQFQRQWKDYRNAMMMQGPPPSDGYQPPANDYQRPAQDYQPPVNDYQPPVDDNQHPMDQ